MPLATCHDVMRVQGATWILGILKILPVFGYFLYHLHLSVRNGKELQESELLPESLISMEIHIGGDKNLKEVGCTKRAVGQFFSTSGAKS